MTVQIPHELLDTLNQCVQETTSRFAGIELQPGTVTLSDDTCTIHTILEGTKRTAVLLWADTALLMRLARRIMRQERVTAQDVADVATEYFNVVCGRITAGLYQRAHIASRFQVPRFRTGRYQPWDPTAKHCILHYTSGENESAQLVFMPLAAQDPKA